VSRSKLTRYVRAASDRTLRVVLSVALVLTYVQFQMFTPSTALAAPPTLSVGVSASDRPLLGGTATFSVTVTNNGPGKAFNIGVSNLFGSSLANPNGRVSFVSASDGSGALSPASVISSPTTTGDTRADFINIRDLEAGETYTMSVVVDTAADLSWAVGDSITSTVTATGFGVPDGTDPCTPVIASTSAKLVPIKIASKTANQSTGVEQNSGTEARRYSYAIEVQNNYRGNTTNTVIVDRLPDGIEFLGQTGATPAPAVSRDTSTGVTTLTWNLGTFTPAQTRTLTYDTGIRYDYYGTAKGGINRATSDLTSPSAIPTAAIIPDKVTLTNNVALTGSYAGQPATDSASARVTNAYLTVAKSNDTATGGNETTVTYTLTASASQYYDIVETDTVVLHDRIPDGQSYVAGSASSVPDTITVNGDGTTDLYWILGPIAHSTSKTVTFKAEIDFDWEGASHPPGLSVVAGDSMTNVCDVTGTYDDLVKVTRPNGTSTSASSAGFTTSTPRIYKDVRNPVTGVWQSTVASATPGDVLEFRVRFNTTNGTSAEKTNIIMGNTEVTDWLPPGMSYNNDATMTYSSPSDFSDPDTATPPAINISTPTTATIGGLQGIAWYLGNVARAGWWEATFTATVNDVSAVADGAMVNNFWKLTGRNTSATPYSERAVVPIAYSEPKVAIAKSLAATPVAGTITGGQEITYTVTLTNTGSAAARDVVATDTIPVGMRATAPTIIGVYSSSLGTTLSPPPATGASWRSSWDSTSGVLTFDLQDLAESVDTSIPASSFVRITYKTRIDNGIIAGTSMTNSARAAYSTRPSGTNRRSYATGPVSQTVQVASLNVVKSAPQTITFGQTATYNATITVPANTIVPWTKLVDTINQDGFAYVPGSSSLTDVTGTPVFGAAFDGTSTPIVSRTTNNNTTLAWQLRNTIDNSGTVSPYVFRLTFSVVADGIEDNGNWENAPTNASTYNRTYTANDNVRAWWTSTAVASRPSSGTVSTTGFVSPTVGSTNPNSNTVATIVQQPVLRTVKTTIGSGPFFGTALADYQVVISNVGASTAYDLSWDDILPSRIDSATLVSVQKGASTLTSGTDYTPNFSALPTATIAFDPSISLSTTQTLTIRYRGRVIPAIASGAPITNTADIDWSSLPGTVTAERVYNDSAREAAFTLDTTSTTINAPSPVITKTQPSGLTTATIGQEFSYKVTVGIPSNTTVYSGQVTDTVDPAFEVVSVDTSPGAFGAAAVGARTATGTPVVWVLPATVTNPIYDSLEMTVTVRVADTFPGGAPVDGLPVGVDGTAQTLLRNNATLRWLDGAVGSTITSNTPLTPAVTVVAPFIRTTKASSVSTAQAGQTITYTVSVENSGTSTAYDVSWRDAIPSRLGAATLSGIQIVDGATTALSSPADFSADFSGLPTVTVDFVRPLRPGAKFLITYTSPVDAGVQSGQTAVNLATVFGASSFPGTVFGERVLPAVSASSTVTLKSPALVVSKAINDAFVQAGQVVTFTVNVTNVGDAPATSVNVTDTLPANVTYVPGSTNAAWTGGGSSTAEPAGAPGPDLSWPLGAALPAGGSITLTFRALVDAGAPSALATNTAFAYGNDADGDAIPADASGWIGADTDVDDTALRPFSITHPGISAIKLKITAQDPFIQVGQAAAFTIRVTNTGDTALATVPLTDVFDPAALTYVSASTAPNSLVPAGTLSWTDITGAGTLAAGASTTITVNFTGASIPAGAVTTNTATASGTDVNGDPAGTVVSAAAITLTRPQVTVTKVLDPAQDTAVQVGAPVKFQIGVRNSGTTTLTAIPLTDTFDAAALAYVGSSPMGVDGPGTIAWANVGPLAPGDATTVTVDFTVIARPASGSSIDTASVAGASDENSDTPPTSTATRAIRITDPKVTVTKSLHAGQDAVVQVGAPVVFDLAVRNSGDTTLTTVPLADAFDDATLGFVSATSAPDSVAPAGTLGWNDITGAASLAPGVTTTVTVTFTALAVPAGQVTTDTATVTGAIDQYLDVAPDSADTESVRITDPKVAITKTRTSADGIIQAGEDVTFTLVVTNTGDTTLTTVPVEDTYDATYLTFASASPGQSSATPGTVRWNNVGTLAPSASATVTVTLTALLNPAGQVTTDTATVVSATDQYGDHPADVSDQANVRITAPSFTLTKTRVSLDPAIQTSQTVTFELTVENTGDTVLTTVPLADTWDPTALSLFSYSELPDVAMVGNASWTLGPIAPGTSHTVTVTFIAIGNVVGLTTTDFADVTNVLDENGDPATDANDTATVDITRPEVSLVKVLHPGQDPIVQVGDTVTYDIGVTNSGDTSLTTIPLTDTFDPAELAFVSAVPAEDASVPAGTLDWNDIADLSPGATTTVTVEFTVLSQPASGVITNSANIVTATDLNGDPAPGNSDAVDVTVTRPDLSVTKTLVSDSQIQTGQAAVFEIEVTNTGDTTLTTVPLSDSFDSAVLSFTSALPAEDSSAPAGTLSWNNLGTLVPGASTVVTATFQAIAQPIGRVTTDTASATGSDENGDSTGPASDDAAVTITRPDISIIKTPAFGQDPFVQVGQVVAWDITVTNTGDTRLDLTQVVDFWPIEFGYAGSSPAPAMNAGFAAGWVFGSLATGESTSVALWGTALSQPPAPYEMLNFAATQAEDEFGDLTPAPADDATVTVTNPAVTVTKALHAGQDTQVQVGDTVTFDVGVANSGDTTLTTVPLTDTFDPTELAFASALPAEDSSSPAGTIGWTDIADLAPGAATTVTVEFTVLSQPAAGLASNLASTTAVDEHGDSTPPSSDTETIEITNPGVSITKALASGQDTHVQAGESVAFDLGVTNSGDTTLTDVPLSDVYDDAVLAFSSATLAPDSSGGGAIDWNDITGAGEMAPGVTTTITVTFTAIVAPAGHLTADTATVSGTDVWGDSAGPDTDTADVSVTRPGVTIVKSRVVGQDSVVQAGDTVEFDLAVTNSGDTTLTTVPLDDTFDDAALGFTSATLTPDLTTPAGTLGWNDVTGAGSLAPSATTTVTVSFTALAVPAGQVTTDTATVTGATDVNSDTAPDSTDTADVRITAPGVSITKTRVSADGAIQAGEQVTFELVATNTGDTDLATVTMGDMFDAAVLGFDSATIAPDSTIPAGTLTWNNLGPLAAGAATTVTVTFTALTNPAGQVTTDTAGVTATDIYGDSPTPDSDTATVKVTDPGFTFTKTRVSLDPAIQTSQTVTFELTVENTGDTTLTSMILEDTWDPTALSLFSVSEPPGFDLVDYAIWWLGPIAPGASHTVTVTFIAVGNVVGLTTTDFASVTAVVDENGDPATDADDTATVDITRPAVDITKTLHAGQDTNVQVGDTVTYDIAVTNSGDTTLAVVPLEDAFDDGVFSFDSASVTPDTAAPGLLSWNNVGPLVVGETTTITVTFDATAVSGGVPSVDTATVSGVTDVNGDPAADATDTAAARVTAPSVSITKSLHAGQDHEIQAGETATFDLHVTNTGDTTLTTVPLADAWDGAVFTFSAASPAADSTTGASADWANVGPLAPGADTTVTVTLLALAAPAELVTIDTATVSGTDEFGDTAPSDNDSASLLVTRPQVLVTKTRVAGQDGQIQVGQTVGYDLAVTNTGDTTLTTVPLADTFDDAALSFTAATTAPDSAVGGTLSWSNVGPLAQGVTTTITVTFTALAVPAGQVTTDTATVTGAIDVFTDTAPDSTDSSNIRITAPAVTVSKTLHAGQDTAVQAGEPVVFDVTVTNTGDTTLTTVPLTDTYDDARLGFISADVSPDATGTGTLDWNNVGPLDPGASTTLVLTFSAISNPPGQVTTNTAEVNGAVDQYGDNAADASDTESVKITAPSLILSKDLETGQDPYIQSGQTVTFDLSVTNTGDTTLTTVPLADTWDAANLVYSSSDTPVTSQVGNNATWLLSDVGPAQTVVVKLTLLAAGAFTPHSLVDTATVVGALDENNDPANDALDTAQIDLTRGAVAVTKSLAAGQDPVVQVGQSVTYDITVTNTGDIDLATVPLADEFDPAVFALVSATPSQDSTGAGIVNWNNVGPLAIGQTATVTVTFDAIGTSNVASSVDTATVSGALDINGDPATGDNATSSATVTRPAVAVVKSLSPGQFDSVHLGANVSYDLTVTNTGDTTLTTVPLIDTFDPAQFEVVSTSFLPTAAPVPGVVSWPNVASPLGLAPGASTVVTLVLKTLVAGPNLVNIATVTGAVDTFGDPAADDSDMNTVLGVYEVGSFVIAKTANPASGTIVLPGDTIEYTLSWENTQSVAIPDVVITDPLPNSVIYTAGTLNLNGVPKTDAVDADGAFFEPNSRTVSFSLGDVSAHATGSATFSVVVGAEEVSARGVRNSALFASVGETLGVAGPVDHPVDPFTIVKQGRDLNGGKLKGGDIIEWTITVTNTGLTPTTHVVVTDTVPNTTVYIDNSIRGQGADDSGAPNLRWDIGTMQVDEVQVLTLRTRVKKGLPAGTAIRNQATVVSDQSRPKRSDDPKTNTSGDPTILVAQTSGSEDWRLPLVAGLLLLAAGAVIVDRRRRLQLAKQTAVRRAAREARGRS